MGSRKFYGRKSKNLLQAAKINSFYELIKCTAVNHLLVSWSTTMTGKNLGDESKISTSEFHWTNNFLHLVGLAAVSRQHKQRSYLN